ncbi:ribonuclease H-like domain-containing protein [Tanacetum coccineum]
MPTFHNLAFSQPNQSIFSQPAVHFQQTQPTQTNQMVSSTLTIVLVTTVSIVLTAHYLANNAKFHYLEKEKYEIWAMKMNTGIQIADENKVRTLLLPALPVRLYAIFNHYDAAKGYLDGSKARFGGNEESKEDEKGPIAQASFNRNFCDRRRGLHKGSMTAAAAPTHSAFIGAASSGSKLTYSDQQSIVPSVYQTSGRSDNIMECVLHSFVAENEPDQDMIYEDFVFEKKAGRKMNYNNQQPARFDRRKVRCYKCLQLGHFARECNVKTVDDKARYSAFKVTEVKTDEPKALVSVDSMVNWSDHAAENKTGEVEKVYGMMAGLHADNGGAGVSDAAAEFAMMGISPKVQNCPLGCDSKINDLNNMYNNLDRLYNDCYIKVQAYQNAVKTLESQKDWYHKTQIALEEKIRVLSANLENTTNTLSYTEKLHDQAQKEKKEWEVKYEATLARFEKWKESSKNLNKLINSSMSTRTKIGLGFKEYFGKDEVFDLSTPSVMYPEPVEEEVKPLYSWFVKAGEMHAVPPSITGTYMPIPYNDKSSGLRIMSLVNLKQHLFLLVVGIRQHLLLLVDLILHASRNLWTARLILLGRLNPTGRGDPSTDNDIGIVDSGCSRSMTRNKEKLDDFVQIKGGIVKFGGGDGRISGKGTIRTSKLDFENVYFC